ncbi:TCP-1/cpn60 chaperonin family protein [Actinidia rufa]|uniref:TCP-1/cpn60 chaperonin family protein n=1 Tax=Actinidia rufa TaxID=165716 RepID=A0A7J0EF70_9ERIC|nr:TCP-1/cpn60 chaperonin family protein [Actinidia rufa]
MEAVQKLDRKGDTGKIVVLEKKTKLRKIVPRTILQEEKKKKPEREIDRSIPEARERGGATGNIMALKKKTKLARFLESRGIIKDALEVAIEPDYRFKLALQRLDDVYAVASGWQKITNVRDLVNVLEDAIRGGYLILIIGDDVEKEGLATLVVNKLRGALKIAAIKAPRFRARKSEYPDDIAILSGELRSETRLGLSLDKTEKEVLGHAAKVVLTKDTTTLVSDGSTQESQSKFMKRRNLRNELRSSWVVFLSFRFGSQMETELKEMKLRVEHALNATEAAVEEGIVVGGWCTLL